MSNDLKVLVPGERNEMAEQIAASQAGDSGKDLGFKNVNKHWLAKTISFSEGINRLTAGKAETEDLELPLEKVSFEESEGKLVFSLDGKKYYPNKYALNQMGTKLGIPNKILSNWFSGDKSDVTLVADILSNGQRHYFDNNIEYDEEGKEVEKDEVNWLFRTRKDNSLRACLSSKFMRLDNGWFLESLEKIIPGGMLSHWNRSDSDSICGNIFIPDKIRKESDSEYSGGCAVTNSEIGLFCMTTNPFLFRFCCQNGMLHAKVTGVSYSRKHLGTKINYQKEFDKLKDCITKQIPLIDSTIDNFLLTKNMKWSGSAKGLIVQSANDLTLSKKQATKILEAYEVEPELSCFGLINAITRASQGMDAVMGYEMDKYAGMLVYPKFWESYSLKSKTINEKEIEKYFVNAA